MSQRNVERVIGMLVTDEAFRRKFAHEPHDTLLETIGCGLELTDCEMQALEAIDLASLQRFAAAIDLRLQKTEIPGGIH